MTLLRGPAATAVAARRDLTVAFIAIGIAAATPLAAKAAGQSMMSGLLWTVATACVCLPAWWHSSVRRNAFHPYAFLTFNAIASFLLPALFFHSAHASTTPSSAFDGSLVLVALAYGFTTVGFFSIVGPIIGRGLPVFTFPSGRAGWDQTLPVVVVVYAVGWLARLNRASLGFSHLPGEVGTSYQNLSFLNDIVTMSDLAFLVILLYLFRRGTIRAAGPLIALCLIAAEMLGGALVGGRSTVVLPLLYAAMAWHWSSRPVRLSWIIVAYVVVLLVAGPLLTAYRSSYYKGIKTEGVSFGAVTKAGASLSQGVESQGGLAQLRSATIRQRGTGLESMMRVLARVPDRYPYQWGSKVVADIGTLLVPRALWAGKPKYDVGVERAATFWDFDREQSGRTAIAIGLPAEVYLNFGWFGLPLFFAFGVFLRALSTWLEAYHRAPLTGLVLSAFVVFQLCNMDRDLASFVAVGLRSAVLHLLFLVIVFRRLPRLTTRAALLTG